MPPEADNSTSAAPPAWDGAHLTDPHHAPDKAQRVRQMFAAVAHRYDLNNRVHSFWQGQVWRRRAVAACRVKTTDIVLDVACGTGDLSLAFAHARARCVLGVDFTHEMLTHAMEKVSTQSHANIHLADGDAMRLPVADASVDVVSIAFGLRNVVDPAAACREFARVLKPGGRLMVLEFTMPANRLIRAGYRLYFDHLMPRTASWISRDSSGAYRYLPKSVSTFASPPEVTGLIRDAGLQMTGMTSLTLGIATIYLAQKMTGAR